MELSKGIIRMLPLWRFVLVLFSIGVVYMLFATTKRLRVAEVTELTFSRRPYSVLTLTDVPPAFHPAMSAAEHATLVTVLRRFADAADAANITYFMYWGTLLGSYRHHGRIPWDDEVDVLVSAQQKSKLESMLKSLAPNYLYAKSKYVRWKVYKGESKTLQGVSWKYPFVDVSFYMEDKNFVWDADPGFKQRSTFRKSDVFPLCRRPFSGLMLPAPTDTPACLQKFNLNQCVSSDYNHSIEQFIPTANIMSMPCNKLWNTVPFVFRTKTDHGTNETLKIGNQVISWFETP